MNEVWKVVQVDSIIEQLVTGKKETPHIFKVKYDKSYPLLSKEKTTISKTLHTVHK